MDFYKHLKNLKELNKAPYIQMPNNIFSALSSNIESNIQQVSFSHSYLVLIGFLYKYTHFVDIDNKSYIQNKDIKNILGYSQTSKTVDKLIKKDGILEEIGLIKTIKDFPVDVKYTKEIVNNFPMREFINLSAISENKKSKIKSIIKNKNYTIKEPTFMFEYDGDIGSLYNYKNTYRISYIEFINFIFNDKFNNIDFILYCYFKSKCQLKNKAIPLQEILSDVGISNDSLYFHLKKLEKEKMIDVVHQGWNVSKGEANIYFFKGV